MLSVQRAHTLISSVIIFALATFIGGAFFLFLSPASSQPVFFDQGEPVEGMTESWLLLDGSSMFERPELPFAVMVDNRPEGRPQSGLSDARIVYETLVEGGTTRFMAVFQNSATIQIGPVRSARPYFIPLVSELDATYTHSGGSAEALGLITQSGVRNIEEISYLGTRYFWRDNNMPGPYNLFTSSEGLRGAAQYLNFATSTDAFRQWRFVEAGHETEGIPREQKIAIDWSAGNDYDVEYVYRPEISHYERWLAGRPHLDRTTSRQLTAANIIIQQVPAERVLDAVGRLAIDVEEQGDAIIVRRGEAVYGTWRKLNLSTRTLFFDVSGREVEFVPGAIWVEIVPEGREVTVE